MAEIADGSLESIDGPPVTASPAVASYVIEIEVYERNAQKWKTRGNKILRRYRDERRQADEDQVKFNILWSNIQTLLPACYAKNPKPQCERRFKDEDPVGRVASEVLERSITYSMDCSDFFDSARSSVLDRLLPGRGTLWERYVPHFRDRDDDADDAGNREVKEEGPEITSNADADDVERDVSMVGSDPSEDMDEGVEVEYEESVTDYVHWENFGHNVARTWDEVYLVWREVYLDRSECEERFGYELGSNIPLDFSPKNLADEKITDSMKKARVYEMWDKRNKTAVWIHRKMPMFLDKRPDPLKLEGFFPCPKPLMATTCNDSIIPTADYTEYQDQARELDQLTARISSVIRAIKVAGVYDASAAGIDRLLSEGTENQLIPVEQWALMGVKGLEGVISWLPLDQVVNALKEMYAAREQIKNDLYEVSGMPDILRGANDPRSTATAERIKGQYGSIRLRSVQDDVQRFVRDAIRIKGQVIAKHFSWQTLRMISGVKLLSQAEKQQIQMMQAAAQQGAPIPPPPQEVMQLMGEPTWEDVEGLLRNNAMRAFRLDIETDSTIGDDNELMQTQRMEFMKVVAPMIAQAVQAGETNPTMVPLMVETIKWTVRSFPQARGLEGIIDQTLDNLSKQPPPPKTDPEMVKAQVQQQSEQLRAQTDLQIADKKAQLEMQKIQVDAEAKIRIAQAEQAAQAAQAQQENELEARRDLIKSKNEFDLAKYKIDREIEASITKARIEAEKAIAVARIGSQHFPSDGTADLIYQQTHETSVNGGDHAVVSGATVAPQPEEKPDADL
jgi:hypothetical protein